MCKVRRKREEVKRDDIVKGIPLGWLKPRTNLVYIWWDRAAAKNRPAKGYCPKPILR